MLGIVIEEGGQKVITPLTGDVGNSLLATAKAYTDAKNSYSETEQLTGGTWIDGKPIYRKVYAGLSFTCTLNAWATVSGIQPPQNVEKLIRGWITRCKISTDNITDIMNAGVQFTGNLVKVHANGAFTNCNEIIVEYTKTTD